MVMSCVGRYEPRSTVITAVVFIGFSVAAISRVGHFYLNRC